MNKQILNKIESLILGDDPKIIFTINGTDCFKIKNGKQIPVKPGMGTIIKIDEQDLLI